MHLGRGAMVPEHPEHGMGVFYERIKTVCLFMSPKGSRIRENNCWTKNRHFSHQIQPRYHANDFLQYMTRTYTGMNPYLIGFQPHY